MIAPSTPPRAGRAGLRVAAALLLAACGQDLTDETTTDRAVPTATAPATPSLTLPAGSTVRLEATDGSDAVRWELTPAVGTSADGATLTADGQLAVRTPGRYLVHARRGSARGTLAVTVTDAGGAPADEARTVRVALSALRSLTLQQFWIEVEPDTVAVAAGGTTTLGALGHSDDGSRWTIRTVWTADGGTVSEAGVYTAPTADGTYRVVATREGDIQTDTAVVVVGQGGAVADSLAPVPAPAPAPPTTVAAACRNEPGDYRRVSDAPWNVLPARQPERSAEGYTYYHDQIPTLSLVEDPNAPASANSVLRVLYPSGFSGGGSPSRWGSPDLGENAGNLYVCLWIRYDPHWTTYGISTDKIYYVIQDGAPVYHATVAYGESDSLFPHALLQFRDQDRQPNYNIGQTHDPRAALNGGGWHKLEVLWEANTPGQANGGFKQWVDDQLITEDHGALWFVEGMRPHWDVVWFDPVYAYPAAVLSREQSFYLDHTVISVK